MCLAQLKKRTDFSFRFAFAAAIRKSIYAFLSNQVQSKQWASRDRAGIFERLGIKPKKYPSYLAAKKISILLSLYLVSH